MLTIETLRQADLGEIVAAFAAIGWDKPERQYREYLAEGGRGIRVALVARVDGAFAGYVTLLWVAQYAPFRQAGIPEVQDLNVLPRFRRQGVASQLLDAVETLAKTRGNEVGIGVGLTADYGAAQRLYTRRGYLPDGRGAQSQGAPLRWGTNVTVDDTLLVHMTKALAK